MLAKSVGKRERVIFTYVHTYIHTYIHTIYTHTHMHACIHIYIYTASIYASINITDLQTKTIETHAATQRYINRVLTTQS